MAVKYPDVTVTLPTTTENALMVIGTVRAALRSAGVPTRKLNEFVTEATAGDYANVITTCEQWVTIKRLNPCPECGYMLRLGYRDSIYEPGESGPYERCNQCGYEQDLG